MPTHSADTDTGSYARPKCCRHSVHCFGSCELTSTNWWLAGVFMPRLLAWR